MDHYRITPDLSPLFMLQKFGVIIHPEGGVISHYTAGLVCTQMSYRRPTDHMTSPIVITTLEGSMRSLPARKHACTWLLTL